MRDARILIRWTAFVAAAVASAAIVLGCDTGSRSAAAPRATATSRARDARTETAGARLPAPSASTTRPLATAPAAAEAPPARRELPGAERLSRKEVRALVERVFTGRLADRELSPDDYERLTDAVMRLRSANRSLRHAETSRASDAAAPDRERTRVATALRDIEKITGVSPEHLGDVLTADEDAPPAAAEAVRPTPP